MENIPFAYLSSDSSLIFFNNNYCSNIKRVFEWIIPPNSTSKSKYYVRDLASPTDFSMTYRQNKTKIGKEIYDSNDNLIGKTRTKHLTLHHRTYITNNNKQVIGILRTGKTSIKLWILENPLPLIKVPRRYIKKRKADIICDSKFLFHYNNEIIGKLDKIDSVSSLGLNKDKKCGITVPPYVDAALIILLSFLIYEFIENWHLGYLKLSDK